MDQRLRRPSQLRIRAVHATEAQAPRYQGTHLLVAGQCSGVCAQEDCTVL